MDGVLGSSEFNGELFRRYGEVSFSENSVFFYDAPPRLCGTSNLAMTAPGSRVIFVCGERFVHQASRNSRHAEASLITSTALTPHIGYDRTDEIVKEAAASGRTWAEVAREKGVDEAILKEVLDLSKMAKGNLG